MTEENMFNEVMRAEVIEVRCMRCGEETIMNAAYAKYVKDGISSCRKCREKER